MENKNCPLCHEQQRPRFLESYTIKGCKMCGMALEDSGKEFCSRICRTKSNRINIK